MMRMGRIEFIDFGGSHFKCDKTFEFNFFIIKLLYIKKNYFIFAS